MCVGTCVLCGGRGGSSECMCQSTCVLCGGRGGVVSVCVWALVCCVVVGEK